MTVSYVGDTHLQIQAQDIRVGNIVWLRENEEVPCDLVLIGTSDTQGLCYVEVNMQLCLLSDWYRGLLGPLNFLFVFKVLWIFS